MTSPPTATSALWRTVPYAGLTVNVILAFTIPTLVVNHLIFAAGLLTLCVAGVNTAMLLTTGPGAGRSHVTVASTSFLVGAAGVLASVVVFAALSLPAL